MVWEIVIGKWVCVETPDLSTCHQFLHLKLRPKEKAYSVVRGPIMSYQLVAILMRTSWIEAVLPKIDIAASAAGPSPHGHDGLG